MPRLTRLLLLFTLIASLAHAQPATAPAPPNIVIILADDLGFSDLSCYGSEIPTPNLDRLAREGLRFTQFYNNARCCPSRASLLTGLYPHQAGVGHMTDDYARHIRANADSPAYQDHLSKEVPTIAEALRPAGYRTLMTGKWHLGRRKQEWPVSRGFNRSFACIDGAMNYFGDDAQGRPAPLKLDDQPFVPPTDGFFATDAFTDRAIEFVEEMQAKPQPFFLYLAYNAPHWPLHAPPADIAKYQGKYKEGWQAIRQQRHQKQIELGLVSPGSPMAPMDHGKQKPWDELTDDQRSEWDLRMAVYAAMIDRMDRNIGRLLSALDRLKIAGDTLVIFVSDNGGAAEDPNRSSANASTGSQNSFVGYGRPWASVSNTPWRLHKSTVHEGGISSPCIVRWPVVIKPDRHNTLVQAPAHLIDLMPTCLELAGTTSGTLVEGTSLVPLFTGKPLPERKIFWEHEGNRAVRDGHWKLVQLHGSSTWELYDLAADRTESRNLAADQPQRVTRLSAEYDRWAQRCGVLPWTALSTTRPAR